MATDIIARGMAAKALNDQGSGEGGADLSNLNADNLTSGTVPEARLPSSLIKQKNILTAGTSLNDYTKAGIYYFSSAYKPSDAPNGAVNGWLVVLTNGSTNVIKQIWLRHGSVASTNYDMYIRTMTEADKWSDWQRIFTSKDIIPAANLPSAIDVVVGSIETTANSELDDLVKTISNPAGFKKALISATMSDSIYGRVLISDLFNSYDDTVVSKTAHALICTGNGDGTINFRVRIPAGVSETFSYTIIFFN